MKKLVTILAVGLITFGLMSLSAMADENPPPPADKADDFRLGHDMLWAQGPGGHGPGRGPGRGFDLEDRMRQRKHLEQLRMLKMLELLELDDDQELPFLTAFNDMRKEQRQVEETSQLITDSLARELHDGSADEARVYDLVDRALELQNQKHRIMTSFMDRARQLLTAEQLGKLIVFHKRFESELLERVGRFRRGTGRSSGDIPEGDG